MRLSRKETAELISSIEGKILVTTHKNPDGDAIGSCLGLYPILKKASPRFTDSLKVPLDNIDKRYHVFVVYFYSF